MPVQPKSLFPAYLQKNNFGLWKKKRTFAHPIEPMTMKELKILHILNYYAPHVGGIEDVCKSIVDGTPQYERKVLCFNDENKDAADWVDGVEVWRASLWKLVARQQVSFTFHKLLRRMLKEYQPDIIHIHVPNPLTSAILLPMLPSKTKLIVHWHSDITVHGFIHTLYHPIERKMLQRANTIVATSPNYIEGSPYIVPHRTKCVIIPNVISLPKIAMKPESGLSIKQLQQQYGENIVLFLGRHVPYKGLEYLIKAVPHVRNNCSVLICGNGSETARLKQQASNLSNVHFLGHIPDDELSTYLRSAKIFAFPSITKNEAFGVALAEAMYCGAVPITFTIPGSGVNWVNKNGKTGIEVPNKDYISFAKAIDKLLSDTALHDKYSANATRRIEEKFIFEHIQDNVTSLYENL